jgi:general secretion pathway protein A
MAVLGERGLGKTTLIRALIQEGGRQNVNMIPLWNSRIPFEEILQILCRGFGLPVDPGGPSGLSIRVSHGLKEACKAGLNVVLLVDEAQEMCAETLESLRLVANQEMAFQKTLQVVFFGLPAFWENLGRHELRQLKQRIGVIATLSPLTVPEGREFIRSRIDRAGGKVQDVFTRGAVDEIIRLAAGSPLRINMLGRKALIRGCEWSRKPVTEKIVRAAVVGPRVNKGSRYWPWVASPAVVLLISLGWVAVSRLSDFSPAGETRFRIPATGSGNTGPIVTGKIVYETLDAPVRGISPPVGTKPALPSGPRSTISPSEKDEISLPGIASGRERPETSLRLELIPPAVDVNPKSAETETLMERGSIPARKKSAAHKFRVVKEGDNFFRMVLEVYGFSNQALWDFIRKHNPGIKDVDRIEVGEKIIFPEWEQGDQQKKGVS